MGYITDHGKGNLVIEGCTISYPHLFVPQQVGPPGRKVGDPKFSAVFILPLLEPDDQQKLNAAYDYAIRQVWADGNPPAFAADKNCFKAALPNFPGRMVISANSKQDDPPRVFIHGQLATKEQAAQVFGGCVVSLATRLFCSPTWKNGISAALNMVRVDDNMNVERLDGRLSSEAAFGITPESFPTPTAPPPDQPGPAVPPQQQVVPGQQPQPGPMPGVQNLTGPDTSFLD